MSKHVHARLLEWYKIDVLTTRKSTPSMTCIGCIERSIDELNSSSKLKYLKKSCPC